MFDGQVARLDKEIADVAREFVLLRVTSMRGVKDRKSTRLNSSH